MNEDKKNISGLSIAALVTGLLGLSIVPIIIGSIDLNRIKKGIADSGGKAFDIAGIVLGALTILIGVPALVFILVAGTSWLWS
jgi:hypothetical protein